MSEKFEISARTCRIFACIEEIYDLSLSGFQFIMRNRIVSKIERAGATSKEKAVTIEEAKFDSQEQLWLNYFAGVFLGKVKRTADRKYYI